MNPAAPSAPENLRAAALEQALEVALARAPREAELIGLTLPAPALPAEVAIAGASGDAFVLAPPDGFECAGLGVCQVITGSGPERFGAVQRQAQALFQQASCHGEGARAEPLRLFGGFAFQSGRVESEAWRGFGEARFVLPRLLFMRQGASATLTLYAMRGELDASGRRRLADETESMLEWLRERKSSKSELSSYPPPTQSAELGIEGREEWSRLVEAIGREIESGRLEKVVLARRVELSLESTPAPAQVLSRLRSQAPECTRFLLATSGQAFLGAAPERLVKKHGESFETEAVAGSMNAEEPNLASRLLESQKDLLEHSMVVRGIVAALSPIAAELHHPRRPEVHRLRHVLHLRTPIRGRLLAGDHVLSLVQRLHPTPSVGGLPSWAAQNWIAAHERDERGWYAGPVGWFDAAGDGEFVVALRSGLLTQGKAHLYVGAGIVSGSSPHEEFAETQWKLAALAGALGVRP